LRSSDRCGWITAAKTGRSAKSREALPLSMRRI
jgi:hypothetical protein